MDDAAFWRLSNELPRTYLGVSIIGHPCARYLWLNFRWFSFELFSGRMYRLFRRGKREEETIVEDLRGAGIVIEHVLDDQLTFDFGSHVIGHPDGFIKSGVPEAPKTEHVAEFKTHNSDSFNLLLKQGVKEFNVIAQDLSSYGLDLYGKLMLPELIDRMAQMEGVEWIRLHYAYPAQFPHEILDVMAKHPNVCKYLDIALQHINDRVLENMRRHINKEQTLQLLEEIRTKVPGIHIRTTLMVGFPGEDEAAFEELKQFIKDARFERMGAFAYCEEEDTFGAKNFEDSIPQEVKEARLSEIMELQETISLEINEAKVGQTMKVIIDREEPDYYIGRTEFDSPEVDPEVLVSKEKTLQIGQFYNVEIQEAMPFELIGRVTDNNE